MAGRGMTFGAPMAWGKGGKGMPMIVKKDAEKKPEPEKAAGREIFGSAKKEEKEGPKLVVGEGAFQPRSLKIGETENEIKKKRINGVLNRMAPEKYESLARCLVDEHKILEDDDILKDALGMIFKRATSQQDLCAMFANLCKFIEDELPAERSKTYRRMLLETVQSEYEELRKMGEDDVPKAKRLGNAQFVGELYAKGLLNSKVMLYLLSNLIPPTEADKRCEARPCHTSIEVFCKLLATAGATLDSEPMSHATITDYFRSLKELAALADYPPRIRFMMMNTEALRSKNWPDTNSKALTIADQQKVLEEQMEKSLQANTGEKGHTGAATAWGSSAEIMEVKSEVVQKPKNESKKEGDGKKDKKKKKK
eukprot:TRINITY_DN19120_c0_g1_i2.p1 TRINITY_DN19120_c0_g1~~TRINITY_DN19120_c0_g1_i2.p1  ORF type:complete len:376 (+),score=148.54 TRINITY_DN19120_c0_g1_i2:28-1128(+)